MKRSGWKVMTRLIGLVKQLTGFMILAVIMGLIGNLCAALLTVFGGFAVVNILGISTKMTLGVIFACLILFALVRGLLGVPQHAPHQGEDRQAAENQAQGHFCGYSQNIQHGKAAEYR